MKLITKCGKKTGSAAPLPASASETAGQSSRLSPGYNVIRPGGGKVVPSRRYRETYEAVKMDEITLGSASLIK